jgi:hypothetical protein
MGDYAEAFRLAEPVLAEFTTWNGLSVGDRVELTSARHAGTQGRLDCFKVQTHRLTAMTEAIPYKTPVVFATVVVRESTAERGGYSISERVTNLRLTS